MADGIMVSVICNAYQHENVIRDALEGFVMQKTNFPFEVLIHDDASSDGTAAIIREYEEKYPEIIKPIYSKENQYSKRDGSLPRLQYGRVKGKYIAFCEGDDYWTDPEKLQKQFDALEAHPEVDMCAHAASMRVGDELTRVISPSSEETLLSAEQVIAGGGGYFATNSLFYRAELQQTQYPFRKVLPFDYSLQILGSLRGGIWFLPDNMSVYRYLSSATSWTSKMKTDSAKRAVHLNRVVKMLSQLDVDTDRRYHEVIQERVDKLSLKALLLEGKYREVLKEHKEELKKYPFSKRAFIRLGTVFPGLAGAIWKNQQ